MLPHPTEYTHDSHPSKQSHLVTSQTIRIKFKEYVVLRGALVPRPLAVEVWLTPRDTPSPTCVILPNLVVLGQRSSVIKEIA